MSCLWMLLMLLSVAVPYYRVRADVLECNPKCSLSLVETIPVGLEYPHGSIQYPETSDVWLNLINSANSSISIASLYWTLRGSDVMPNPDPASSKGEAVMAALAAKAPNVKMRLAVSGGAEDYDTGSLEEEGAEVRQVNMTALVGAGVLHTKLILVDNKHFYIGSANTDWRSLSHVKEMGVIAEDCVCLAQDMAKIFEVYWIAGNSSALPSTWPDELKTSINKDHPALLASGGYTYSTFLSSSPPAFSPSGRTGDLDAVLHTIRSAKRFIKIAVMDYIPVFLYSKYNEFWPYIDDELRRAYVTRGVDVKLLVSKWQHTRRTMMPFLRSLASLSDFHNSTSVQVKWFQVPSNSTLDKIPYARVNHNKYMVTDETALIGTSNWSADYFTDTAGISLVINPTAPTGPSKNRVKNAMASSDLRAQLSQVFTRDWESKYASALDDNHSYFYELFNET